MWDFMLEHEHSWQSAHRYCCPAQKLCNWELPQGPFPEKASPGEVRTSGFEEQGACFITACAGSEQTSNHSSERQFWGSPKCSNINTQGGEPLEGV